jgi:hypothetical protein
MLVMHIGVRDGTHDRQRYRVRVQCAAPTGSINRPIEPWAPASSMTPKPSAFLRLPSAYGKIIKSLIQKASRRLTSASTAYYQCPLHLSSTHI